MKLAAVMMVRNEAAIIADSIGHLLHHVGVDALYVADNGSTDATAAILRAVAAEDGRVRVHSAPGPFHQPEVLHGLIQCAMRDGADWLLPTDADEFLWMDGAALRARCAASGAMGGFQTRVVNFVQLRSVLRDRPGSIITMGVCARPVATGPEARGLVERSSLPFVRMAYPSKLLLRAAPAIVLHRGQHAVDGLAGPISPEPIADVLHAPIRARDDLSTRVSHGRRALAVAPDPETSWHVKRLVGMDEAALDQEWRANSLALGWPTQEGFRIDLRLCRIGLRLRSYRRRMLAGLRCRHLIEDALVAKV